MDLTKCMTPAYGLKSFIKQESSSFNKYIVLNIKNLVRLSYYSVSYNTINATHFTRELVSPSLEPFLLFLYCLRLIAPIT